jgi:phospholipase A1
MPACRATPPPIFRNTRRSNLPIWTGWARMRRLAGTTTMPPRSYRFLLCLPFLPLASASAQQLDATLTGCARIAGDAQRLACYDSLAHVSAAAPQPTAPNPSIPTTPPDTPNVPAAPSAPAVAAVPVAPADSALKAVSDASAQPVGGFSLADYWELDQAHKRGVFDFRPHTPTYLIATRTAHPNDAPYRPFRDISDLGTGLAHSELVFQLGFKLKLVENAFDKPVDVWFGYTQNSFWQASNHKASSPFRETNYQPEIMIVTPLNFSVLGMNARLFNLGIVHQSNGQSSTLSRSWNRVYAQVGLEREGWTVMGRVWKRINEPASTDDNRDIVDYLGHGDVNLTYRHNGSDYSALVRRNFSTGRGAVQLSWAWPLAGHFKGYTQLFSGYGQSLIDYNYYQNVLGLGLQGTF